MYSFEQAEREYLEPPDDEECNCDHKEMDVICADCGEHAEYCDDHGGTNCCGARKWNEKEYEVNEER